MTDDELELWQRLQRGDAEAREELLLLHLGLVMFWAAQIAPVVKWANRDDLIQEGIIGLVQAVDKFDLSQGREFRSYARNYIRGAMLRNPETSRNVRRHAGDRGRKARAAHDDLLRKWGRTPTLEEIAEQCGLTVKQVLEALDATAISFAGAMPDPEALSSAALPATQVEKVLVREALSHLSERDALILARSVWGGESDPEIASSLHMKPATVSKARKRAIIKLRALLTGDKDGESQ
jgi:RNA polymerase sigma factor (sigma-70 family)